ncbi:MAG: hypothetical protein ABIT20_05195 [Gemmatimonadaceae bacterium]
MITPPLTTERLLEALTVRSDFRDGILGDLAEEFAERAERDGEAHARRWYYSEAAGVVPHLLHDWGRSLGFREARRLANVLFASYFLVELLVAVVQIATRAIVQTLGISAGFLGSSPQSSPTRILVLLAVVALMFGYCASSLDKKTPLASAILFGAVWAAAMCLATIFIAPAGTSMWFLVAGMVIMFVGTTAGGILQVHSARFSNREAYQEWRGKVQAS